jgi:hypothetical protein
MVAEPSTYYNTSSCVDAANIIRTMRSGASHEMEDELGCRNPNQNCYINNNNNNMMFSMMDKYSSQPPIA